MTRKIGFSKVSWLGVLAGLLGYFFHATMRSGGSAIPLVAFSVLMALLFWLSAVTLEKKSRYDRGVPPDAKRFYLQHPGGDWPWRRLRDGAERRRNRGSRHRPSGAFRRAGAFDRRRIPDEKKRAVRPRATCRRFCTMYVSCFTTSAAGCTTRRFWTTASACLLSSAS